MSEKEQLTLQKKYENLVIAMKEIANDSETGFITRQYAKAALAFVGETWDGKSSTYLCDS